MEEWHVSTVDELSKRTRVLSGWQEYDTPTYDTVLHQVTGTPEEVYTWNVNGNLQTRTGGLYGDATFTHDWRDRLTQVNAGGTTTDIVVDPLGRMVGKLKHTSAGDLARAYLHDGDQVAVEYVQPAGSSSWQPERRHLWSTWIDQLALEQVDTDGDGSLDKTLYPITDMLGSVQLLTDDAGKIVERIEYDPDGTPHFFSADTQSPAVTRVLWTGNGQLPTGESVEPHAFELGLSEEMDPASMTNATATLTPEGGSAVDLSVTLGPDGRSAILTGPELAAGTNYALHFEGLRDTSGNLLQPEDRMLSVADPESFEVIADTSAPVLLAVMDGNDGIYLLFDEAVQGADMASAIQLMRQGNLVEGETERVAPRVLKWYSTSTDLGGGFLLPGAQYSLGVVGIEDLAGNPAGENAMSFTHLAGTEGQLLIARQAPTDSYPMAASGYGLTTLFQGRTWHSDLGMYYYRARWYLPDGGVFGERDPVGPGAEASLFAFLGNNPSNLIDPSGSVPSSPGSAKPLGGLEWATKYRKDLLRAAKNEWAGFRPEMGKILGDTTDLVTNWLSMISPTDLAGGYLTGGLLDLAEKYGGSAGVSIEGLIAKRALLGGHAGINWQWFAPNEDDPKQEYTLAFFRFDTLKQVKNTFLEGEPQGRPPLGVAGEIASAGLGINVAMAFQENAPRLWEGFFETLSFSWPAEPPIPSGASLFYSVDWRDRMTFAGAEVSWGGGVGAAYSRPYFKQFLVELHFDRATLEAFVNHSFFRMIRKGKKPSIDFISWW